MLFVDTAHKSCSRWQDLVDVDEDGLFRGQLYALTDDIDKLSDSKVGWNEVLLLVDDSDI